MVIMTYLRWSPITSTLLILIYIIVMKFVFMHFFMSATTIAQINLNINKTSHCTIYIIFNACRAISDLFSLEEKSNICRLFFS